MRRLVGLVLLLAWSAQPAHASGGSSLELLIDELQWLPMSADGSQYWTCEDPSWIFGSNPQFFSVNGTSISTPLVGSGQCNNSGCKLPPAWSGAVWAQFRGPFDAKLLRPGLNTISVNITIPASVVCVDPYSENRASLVGPDGNVIPLFGSPFIRYHGQQSYVATTSVNLRQSDPALADEINRLRQAIADKIRWILDHAMDALATAVKLDRLASLSSALNTLLDEGFDQYSEADIDATLSPFSDLGPEIQDAVDTLLNDLKMRLDDLRTDVAGLLSDFVAQLGSATDVVVTGGARSGGFDPSDPNNYNPAGDSAQLPDVSVPQVGTDPFDPSHDPYAGAADAVIAKLNATLFQGQVQDRGTFQSVVQSWQQNQDVLSAAFRVRSGLSKAEWNAFVNAQQRVRQVIRQHMDDQNWFLDTPIPESLKRLVDGLMIVRMAQQAHALKGNLNLWVGPVPTPEQQMIIDSLNVILDGGLRSLDDGATEEDPTAPLTLSQIVDGAIVVVKEVAKFGVYLTPVGKFIQVCEIVTGKELCLPGGRDMSNAERVYSGIGVVVGSAKFWSAVGTVAKGIGRWACGETGAVMGAFKDVQILVACASNAARITPAACPLGKLVKIGQNRWKSTSGLIYGPHPVDGNRVLHVLRHTVADPTKKVHSVFSVARKEMTAVIDEAWAKKGSYWVGSNGNWNYDIASPRGVIGTLGETRVRIVVRPGTVEIVTAHPLP